MHSKQEKSSWFFFYRFIFFYKILVFVRRTKNNPDIVCSFCGCGMLWEDEISFHSSVCFFIYRSVGYYVGCDFCVTFDINYLLAHSFIRVVPPPSTKAIYKECLLKPYSLLKYLLKCESLYRAQIRLFLIGVTTHVFFVLFFIIPKIFIKEKYRALSIWYRSISLEFS